MHLGTSAAIALLAAVTLAAPVGAARDADVTYRVGTVGDVEASPERFRQIVEGVLSDARGWSLRLNLRFRHVRADADLRIMLASPAEIEAASPICSARWSCRVRGRALINDERWRRASPAWPGSLLDYRRYVINHEVGHWLGLDHARCPGRGEPAPVMLQQSKGLGGCQIGPWPSRREQARVAGLRDVRGWPELGPSEGAHVRSTG